MNPNFIIFLIAIPMATGVVSMLMPRRALTQRIIGVVGLTLNLLFTALLMTVAFADGGQIIVSHLADWPAPFGITAVVDPMSSLMLFVSAIVLLCTYLYCIEQLGAQQFGSLFYPLFHLLAVGVQWSFIAGDLFNLFVAFEIMLMASYVLLTLGGAKAQLRHAYKYVMLNLLASMLFVAACAFIYGHTGTLNLADLARLSHTGQLPRESFPAIAVLLFVFGAKTAIFPLWFWLPDTYHTLPAGLGALFSGLLTKVGAYVMLRIFVMVFGPADGELAGLLRPVLMVTAGVTMFAGVLGAVSMGSIRRILSIHIISQVGYMVLAVALGIGIGMTEQGRVLVVAGGIFFVLHNMVVKSALFLCCGLMRRHSGTDTLEKMGGLARKAPWLATLFMIAALSLAGLPPFSGFFAKYVLIREAFGGQYYVLAGVALATSVLTLMSMLKIWNGAFWSPLPVQSSDDTEPHPKHPTRLAMTAVSMLVVVALVMGLGAEQVLRATRTAASTVIDPTAYVRAVMNVDLKPAPVAMLPVEEEIAP